MEERTAFHLLPVLYVWEAFIFNLFSIISDIINKVVGWGGEG